MLLSSSKDQPKHPISERDLILANALAYVESIEEKIVEQDLAKKREPKTDQEAGADSSQPSDEANA